MQSGYAQGVDGDLSGGPCDSDIYTSDTLFFRATGIGVNADLRRAERLARLDATSNLAANISVTIESIAERYFVEQSDGDSTEYSSAFKQLTRLVSRQQLSNVEIICTQTDYDGEMFTHRVAVEVSTGDVLTGIEEDFSNDPSINHLFDKGLFERVFIEELNVN
ncbi:MAG: hypothetical protein EA408_13030 [Marinilabiliales bacterium]|nr:MAG: hypothetical protein EA408_13030 [Marinilabiliales bacterium]